MHCLQQKCRQPTTPFSGSCYLGLGTDIVPPTAEVSDIQCIRNGVGFAEKAETAVPSSSEILPMPSGAGIFWTKRPKASGDTAQTSTSTPLPEKLESAH